MFTNVSWASYLLLVGLAYLSWYSFIGIKYYRSAIRSFFSGKKQHGANDLPGGTPGEEVNFFIEESVAGPAPGPDAILEDGLFRDVDHLIGKIKALLTSTLQQGADKKEFSQYLGLLLAEYPAVRESVFRSQINELIAGETAYTPSLALSQEEAEGLW